MTKAHSKYDDRIKTLRRRRDFLNGRIAGYQGKDSSRDRAEAASLSWAISVIKSNRESAVELIEREQINDAPQGGKVQ